MTCAEAQQLISGYLDGELEEPVAEAIGAHLEGCPLCSEYRRGLSALSGLFASCRQCDSPSDLWGRIEAKVCVGRDHTLASGSVRRWFAAAAVLGVASFVSTYLVTSRTWFTPAITGPIDTAYGLALGVYVQEMQEGKQVYDRFLSTHQAHEASPDYLVRQVGFSPLLPSELPDGFQLDKSYVLATTCCKAIELRYVKGSELITVFQQGEGHPVIFDGFEDGATEISGVACRRAKIGDVTVVNWDSDGRNTTLLARAELFDIETMVAYLSQSPRRR